MPAIRLKSILHLPSITSLLSVKAPHKHKRKRLFTDPRMHFRAIFCDTEIIALSADDIAVKAMKKNKINCAKNLNL